MGLASANMHNSGYTKIMKYLSTGSKYPLVCAFDDPITLTRSTLHTMLSERLTSGKGWCLCDLAPACGQHLSDYDSLHPWTVACQVSLSFTVSQSLLKLMSIESVMLSNHLILH